VSVNELTKDNFENTINDNEIVLVDFWAPWCGPCKAFKPIFEETAEANPDITFAACNTDEQQELAASFSIRSIPTLMAFRDKILLYAQPGMLPKEALTELIGKIRELDMDAVRAEIAQREKEATVSAG